MSRKTSKEVETRVYQRLYTHLRHRGYTAVELAGKTLAELQQLATGPAR